jgi:glycine/D-amino acid oxidase-like deaminating enzyme
MADRTCDVLVIGAGIAGASTAWHLAHEGVETVLVERSHPASGPTGKSSAISHLFYTMPELSRLARDGCQLLKDLPQIGGGPKVFHETGMMWCVGENNVEEWRRCVHRIRDEEGGGIDELSVAGFAVAAPGFTLDGIAMAVWEPAYGYADPYEAVNGFVAAARAEGATIMQQSEVTGFTRVGDRVVAANLADGTVISSATIAVAAGPWTKRLLAGLGARLPLHIERHGMCVLDAPGRALDVMPFCWCDDVLGNYARPEGADTVLIGGWSGGGTGNRNEEHLRAPSVDVAGEYFEGFTQDESVATLQSMVSRVPALEQLGIRPGYACMYDMSPDDLPIFDAVPGIENMVFAAGSSGHGFKLGPAVGRGLAEWALGTRPALFAPLGLDRFDR